MENNEILVNENQNEKVRKKSWEIHYRVRLMMSKKEKVKE